MFLATMCPYLIVVLYCVSIRKNSCTFAMSELNDNITGTDELICNIKITVEDIEEAGIASESVTSFCTETNELYKKNLQVPNSLISSDDNNDTNEMKKSQYSIRNSMTSLAAEVFTKQNITTAVKCRLVTTLTITIFIMILLFLSSIVLYNINPPSAEKYATESTIFYNMEVDSCSVSANMINDVRVYIYSILHSSRLRSTSYPSDVLMRIPSVVFV